MLPPAISQRAGIERARSLRTAPVKSQVGYAAFNVVHRKIRFPVEQAARVIGLGASVTSLQRVVVQCLYAQHQAQRHLLNGLSHRNPAGLLPAPSGCGHVDARQSRCDGLDVPRGDTAVLGLVLFHPDRRMGTR